MSLPVDPERMRYLEAKARELAQDISTDQATELIHVAQAVDHEPAGDAPPPEVTVPEVTVPAVAGAEAPVSAGR